MCFRNLPEAPVPLDSPTLEPVAPRAPLPYELARFARNVLAMPDLTADKLAGIARSFDIFAQLQAVPSGGEPAHYLAIADLLRAFVPVLRALEPARRAADADARP